MQIPEPVAARVVAAGKSERTVQIQISYDVVRLLSEQLYASPVKAAEELVVNGWDAGADVCSVMVDVDSDGNGVIAVFDDGAGMTLDQLGDLWHIGVSRKPALARPRKQIGKFGIGKLASYAVARNATYITKSGDGVLSVSINFDDLLSRTDKETGISTPLELDIRSSSLNDLKDLKSFSSIADSLQTVLGLEKISELEDASKTWTLVILENLRERAKALSSPRRLRWVLQTAMPYASDFQLYLNSEPVVSGKHDFKENVRFALPELEPARIAALNKTGTDWHVEGDALVSSSFPSGVRGYAVVTDRSLYREGGKSEDLGRSHGFFVRVFKRLINETDPLFGARPLSFSTWYRFAAEIEADDLNPFITAARDDLEQSELKPQLRELLIAIFNQARDLNKAQEDAAEKAARQKPESEREYVSRRLFEQPLADALIRSNADALGDNASSIPRWSTVDEVAQADLNELVAELYQENETRRTYRYVYSALGQSEPFVSFNPAEAVITLNEDHDVVQEFGDSPGTRRLLEVFATAECLLEAYLYEAGIPVEIVREVLDRRDLLLRSLSRDESQSLTALATEIRTSATDSTDSKRFEIAVVGGVRALGFAAKHVSGSGTPDGTAKYRVWGAGPTNSLILETKSSQGTPSLNAIDIAGLTSHMRTDGASGVLLVAPNYPGAEDPESEVNKRAVHGKVSCWTAEQLAQVVELAEKRHITASQIQEVALASFSTLDVAKAVARMTSEPGYTKQAVYQAILDALQSLGKRLKDRPRTVDMVAAETSRTPELENVSGAEILQASRDLAQVSRGLLHVTEDEKLVLLGDLEELRRRTVSLTDHDALPRRMGTFRDRTS